VISNSSDQSGQRSARGANVNLGSPASRAMQKMTMNKTGQVVGVDIEFLLAGRSVSGWSRYHRSLNFKLSTENLPLCVVFYSVEGGAEVKEHESTDLSIL